VWMGVYSSHFLRPMNAAVMRLLSQTENRKVEYAWGDFGLRIADFGFGTPLGSRALSPRERVAEGRVRADSR